MMFVSISAVLALLHGQADAVELDLGTRFPAMPNAIAQPFSPSSAVSTSKSPSNSSRILSMKTLSSLSST